MSQLDDVDAALARLALRDEALRTAEGSRYLLLGQVGITSGSAQPAKEFCVLLTVALGLQG